MTEEEIRKMLQPVQWDMEYWASYVRQYQDDEICYPSNMSEEEIQEMKLADIEYCKEKFNESENKLQELKDYYAEYLI